ncbi:hypothetical protein KCP78_07380 [Salmonella enterica subsp. enterica]|nr:hypothetical protein KCP78_07380 [Salmonella enterica subsp. enterica]
MHACQAYADIKGGVGPRRQCVFAGDTPAKKTRRGREKTMILSPCVGYCFCCW